MKNIIDILHYTENFTDRIITEIFSIFDLWSIHPLQNTKMILCSGLTSDTDRFVDFINNHIDKDQPHDLLIYVGVGEKNYPTIMLNKSKKAIKVKFDNMHPNSIGTPLYLPWQDSRRY